MNVLITGAYGFIGRHAAAALAAAGHSVVCGGRGQARPALPCRHMQVDFARDVEPRVWHDRLTCETVEVVVNAVGIMNERPGHDMETLHITAPRALFEACAALDVRVIQISALGADEHAVSRFHVTKRTADDRLLVLHPNSVVLQPSLVYGSGGASARLFAMLATLPVIPLPGSGDQLIQPVHVDDVAAVIVAAVSNHAYDGSRIALVGPTPMTLKAFLAELRLALDMPAPHFVSIPPVIASAAMQAATWLGVPWASTQSLQMLERGNTADAAATSALLGRMPRPIRDFVSPSCVDNERTAAKMSWLAALLRACVALVWLVSGIVSLGIYPMEDSVALVARTGVSGTLAVALVYAGAAIDIALGLATLLMRERRIVWLVQVVVIVGYTAIISVWLPELWLHPFGPVLKNIPMLAAIYVLYQIERR